MINSTDEKIDWREKLRLEWMSNGADAMLDLASRTIHDLEYELNDSRETVRQAINIIEQGK